MKLAVRVGSMQQLVSLFVVVVVVVFCNICFGFEGSALHRPKGFHTPTDLESCRTSYSSLSID